MASIVEVIEDQCIGCTKCIDVCPTDAIVGAPKQIHAVLSQFCIGCMLCLPPCPTQCFKIVEQTLTPAQRQTRAEMAKKRVQGKKARLERKAQRKAQADAARIEANIKENLAAILARKKVIPAIKHESESN